MTEFSIPGSARDVSRAIEEYARATGRVGALVVPWESDATTVNIAVTSVKADGWAIEHTTLGTVRLNSVGPNRTAIAVLPNDVGEPGPSTLFRRFAADLQRHLAGQSGDAGHAGQS